MKTEMDKEEKRRRNNEMKEKKREDKSEKIKSEVMEAVINKGTYKDQDIAIAAHQESKNAAVACMGEEDMIFAAQKNVVAPIAAYKSSTAAKLELLTVQTTPTKVHNDCKIGATAAMKFALGITAAQENVVDVNSNGEISTVQRRPSSFSASISLNGNLNGSSSADFVSLVGKRKEREKNFDDPSVIPVDYRRRSDFKKVGFEFKPPPPPPLPPSSSAGIISSESRRRIRSGESGDGGDGIAAVREKLMFDLQTAADKMKDAILREGIETEEEDCNPPSSATVTAASTVGAAASEAAEGALRPWNLRTRRAACKAPTGNGFSSGCAGTSNGGAGGSSPAKSLMVDLVKPNSGASPSRAMDNNKSSPRLRSVVAGAVSGAVAASASPSTEKKERAKFSVSLTRQDIDEDFLAIAGRRPPRRPQKRAKYIQKNLDTLFPGLWLTEITADMYKVPETQ
ncbi:hypothetical protein ACH5RR_030160 [Cinchona calisaya]|uniref:Uncharacterized protein n=1 Tax=Cinchona calisaya TaxID=153742 RepID=A0ABD2YWW4_9GENT